METTVKERPILFSGPMVRALLDGSKTQTRRAMKPQPVLEDSGLLWWHYSKNAGSASHEFPGQPAESWLEKCPYGKPGDRLWVRETAIISPRNFADYADYSVFDSEGYGRLIQYLATHPNREAANSYKLKATPSIFMPRWASRILLEVVAVRVEQVQQISEADAVAEGITNDGPDTTFQVPGWHAGRFRPSTAAMAYRFLWEDINGVASWATNPYVWVVEFKVIEVKGGKANE